MLLSKKLTGAFNSMNRLIRPAAPMRAGKIAITHILCPAEAIKAAIPKKIAEKTSVPITRVFLVPFKRPLFISSGNFSNFIIRY